jgi:hypothetical protein
MQPYQEWAAQEDVEMHPESDDPNILNMAGVHAIATIKIENNFSTQQEYRDYLIKEFEL